MKYIDRVSARIWYSKTRTCEKRMAAVICALLKKAKELDEDLKHWRRLLKELLL